jgi:hypothetical protein
MSDDAQRYFQGAGKTELAIRDKLQALEALAAGAWKPYADCAGVVTDYVSLVDGGQEVPAEEWRHALDEVGENRRTFASDAFDAVKGKLADATANLASERADLGKVTAALEDVKGAIDDAAEAERLTGVVFRLEELAEFAEHPSAKKGFDLVRGKAGEDEKLVEEGIGNLGQYEVLTTLASHGFASVEELQRRVETAQRNVSEAAAVFEQHESQEELAAQYKEWRYPPPG